MQSFARGWSFLKQAWQMALADRDLIKPSVLALIAGLIVSVVGIIPIAGVALLLGTENLLGQVILFILGAILVFLQFSVGYVFSAMTVYLIYGYLAEGDGRMDKAWAIVSRDWLDLFSLAAASTAVNLLKGFIKGKGKGVGRNILAGLIDAVWTEAAFLILPAMVIEDINIKDALKRIGGILKDNLLLIGISTVGVKTVNSLLGLILGAVGIALGFGAGLGIVSMTGPDQIIGLVVGIGAGIVVTGIFIMIATVITSYTATAYHTCLYLWARDAERAQASGTKTKVAAPAPLASVLGE